MDGILEGRFELAGAGDLGELYERHAPEALRVAYLLTGDRALAEDLVQDAFVRMVGRLGHIRYRDAFPAYLRQTVVNLGRMHFRRRSKERLLLQADPRIIPGSTESASIEQIRMALMSLPCRNRVAIVFRYYCDLPDGETATILSCAPGTVRSLISRGLEQMRESVGALSDG